MFLVLFFHINSCFSWYRCIMSVRGSIWSWAEINDPGDNLPLFHVMGNTHTGKKFLNQYFKAERFITFGNQLTPYIMNEPLHSEAKQCSWSSSLLLFLFRFCATAASSSCLFSLFELCGKCCTFPIGIRDGVRPCYPVIKVTNTMECLWMCVVAWKYNENTK